MRRLKLLPFILLLLFAFISCKVESDDLILGDAQANYKLYEPYIDEYGNKGVIACITRYVESGELAEVIVLSADETEERWGPMDELVYQAEIEDNKIFKSQTYGLGVLQSMKAMGINRFPAQKWCDAKNEDEEFIVPGDTISVYNGSSLLDPKFYSIVGHDLIYVNNYTRADGTKVSGYYRRHSR